MSVLTAKDFCITTFPSTHMALTAEKVVKAGNIEFLLVPLPIGISASCGLGLKYFQEEYVKIKEILTRENVRVQGNYYCVKENGKLIVTTIN